jgi:hypothetical protein
MHQTGSSILDNIYIPNEKVKVGFIVLLIMLYTIFIILEAIINYTKRRKERKKGVAVSLGF